MRITLAYLFVLLYGVALLRPISPLVDYSINKDYISTVLCINKDKPEMQCNGKCHLAKELKKAGDENNSEKGQIDFRLYPIGFVNILNCEFEVFHQPFKAKFAYDIDYSFDWIISIFHPPAIS